MRRPRTIISNGRFRPMKNKARYEYMLYWTGFVIPDFVKVTYTFRKLLRKNSPGPGLVKLKDGDGIQFGQGKAEDIEKLGGGPLPTLCNLRYAVARVFRVSGA